MNTYALRTLVRSIECVFVSLLCILAFPLETAAGPAKLQPSDRAETSGDAPKIKNKKYQMVQKVRLKRCIWCPRRSCCLCSWHTPGALCGMMTHAPTTDDHNYFVHAPTLPSALQLRELSASEACTRGQAERRAHNPATRLDDSIPTQTSKCCCFLFFFSIRREPSPANRLWCKNDPLSRSYSDVWLAACLRH